MQSTDEQVQINDIYCDNKNQLLNILKKDTSSCLIGLEIEHFIIDQTNTTVVYQDDPGIYHLLCAWEELLDDAQPLYIDGKLFGWDFFVTLPQTQRKLHTTITLEPASQLEFSLGPANCAQELLAALEILNAQFSAATKKLGVSWKLVAQGTNPAVRSPYDLPLIDKKRYQLMDAYFAHTGEHGVDMMRTSASTQISLDWTSDGLGARRYRCLQLLSPVISFLCDNSAHLRNTHISQARAHIWDDVDPQRCGCIRSAFNTNFTEDDYIAWLENICPILFTDENGQTSACDKITIGEILRTKKLTEHECLHLLSMVFPDIRLKGYMEVRAADALDARLAVAYACFLQALIYDEDALSSLEELLDTMDYDDFCQTKQQLYRYEWNAQIYHKPAYDFVLQLIELAEKVCKQKNELEILLPLTQVWRKKQRPKDLIKHDL